MGKLPSGASSPRSKNALALDGPHPLPPECRTRLEQNSRLLPPTDLAYIADGVTGYAWVEPGEVGLLLPDGSECRSGAFAFVYDDARHDRFFCRSDEASSPSRTSDPLAYNAAI